MSLNSPAGTAVLAEFKQILPGLNVCDLAEKIHELAMAAAKERRLKREAPPYIASASSLRGSLLYTTGGGVNEELSAFLEPILDQIKVDLSKNPAYLNGEVPVDLFNAGQLRTELMGKGIHSARAIFGTRLNASISSAASKGTGRHFCHIPAAEFERICAELNTLASKD